MGWIRIKGGKNKLMLNSSMQYIACIGEDRIVKILEVEKLFEIVQSYGRQINWEEFDRLQKNQREQNRQWWDSYRKKIKKEF